MNIDEEESNEQVMHSDGVKNILKTCAVCDKMDEEACQIIKDYVVQHSKKMTLHTIIDGVLTLMSEMPQKKKHTSFNHSTNAAKKAQNIEDIMNHIWSCIAPNEVCIRMIICNSVLMEMLKKAQNPHDTAMAVKLLLQTQAAERKS